MEEASWNGPFDTRWEDAPLGREAIRLVQWLREGDRALHPAGPGADR
ncbi:MAG TPA: hypothetical protein VF395_06455 [Polyangiaceae bacterium]